MLAGLLALAVLKISTPRTTDRSAKTSERELANAVRIVVPILGGHPAYSFRTSRRWYEASVDASDRQLEEARAAVEKAGWRFSELKKTGQFQSYKYCRGRITFLFERGEKEALTYSARWETNTLSFAFCRST